VNEHKDRKNKSSYYMNKVSKVEAASSENLVNDNKIGKDQCPTGDKDQGHKEIKYGKIGDFLKRVEFSPAINGVWGLIATEDPKYIIVKLYRNFFYQPASPHPVVKAIFGE